MLFLALFSCLESQLCTSRGIQCYSSGLPLRFPFLWCISTAVQVTCYVVYWISKALWSQTGDLIPPCLIEGTTSMSGQHFSQCWQLVTSCLIFFLKKHKLVCVGLQFINWCRKANSGCTWSNKLFIYVANRWCCTPLFVFVFWMEWHETF